MAAVVDEQLLDDRDALVGADSGEVLLSLASAGAQVREATAIAGEAPLHRLAEDGRPRALVVASRGGSGLVADVTALAAGTGGSGVPVCVRPATPLPGWVGALDLVVAVSLSGRGPGPLALAVEAARRGCRLLTVGAPGSPLEEVCLRARGVHVPLPPAPHRSTSRAAVWSMLPPVLLGLEAAGLLRGTLSGGEASARAAIDAAADVLDREAESCGPAVPSYENPAKGLTLDLSGSFPVVLGDGDLTGVVARRAASVLGRTARVPAVSGALPDDAGEVVATFGGPFAGGGAALDDVFADPFVDGPAAPRLRLVLLRDPGTSPDRAALADAVAGTAEEAGLRVTPLEAPSGPELARLAGLVARTDFAATYLALGLGLDPVASPHVAELRRRT